MILSKIWSAGWIGGTKPVWTRILEKLCGLALQGFLRMDWLFRRLDHELCMIFKGIQDMEWWQLIPFTGHPTPLAPWNKYCSWPASNVPQELAGLVFVTPVSKVEWLITEEHPYIPKQHSPVTSFWNWKLLTGFCMLRHPFFPQLL